MSAMRYVLFSAFYVLSAYATPVIVSGQAYYQHLIGADTVTFSNIVLGSPLLITRIDLTIGNGINNVNATRSLFFDLPGGPAGFGLSSPYTASGNGLITGIQTVDAPGDGLSDRTLSVTFTSWVTGGVFVVSTDVDRLGPANSGFSQGSGGSFCINCDIINGNDFFDGGAITFRLWLASADAGKIIVQPTYVEIAPGEWSRAPSNGAVATWATTVEVEDAPLESVPEPSSLALAAIGLGAVAVAVRRRNKSKLIRRG